MLRALGLLFVLLLAGCVSQLGPSAPVTEPQNAAPADERRPFGGTFHVVVSQVQAGSTTLALSDDLSCIFLVSDNATTFSGKATAAWTPSEPMTQALRFGSSWGKKNERPIDVTGNSPLTLAIPNTTINASTDFVVFLNFPPGTGATVKQDASITLEVSYLGAEPSVKPGSCSINRS